MSQWCQEAKLVRDRKSGTVQAVRVRRAQVVGAVLTGVSLARTGAGVCWESASQCWHDQAMERSSITSVIGIIEALVCAAELSVVVGGCLLGVG